jgi:hypothetical protein
MGSTRVAGPRHPCGQLAAIDPLLRPDATLHTCDLFLRKRRHFIGVEGIIGVTQILLLIPDILAVPKQYLRFLRPFPWQSNTTSWSVFRNCITSLPRNSLMRCDSLFTRSRWLSFSSANVRRMMMQRNSGMEKQCRYASKRAECDLEPPAAPPNRRFGLLLAWNGTATGLGL